MTTKEITIEDMKNAMKYLDDNAVYKTYEDDYQEIVYKNGFPYSIKLTEKGKGIIDGFIDIGQNKIEMKGYMDFHGVKVVITDKVQEDEIRWK